MRFMVKLQEAVDRHFATSHVAFRGHGPDASAALLLHAEIGL